MKNYEMIIKQREHAKYERMLEYARTHTAKAKQEKEFYFDENNFKYINSAGQVKYCLSQELFDALLTMSGVINYAREFYLLNYENLRIEQRAFLQLVREMKISNIEPALNLYKSNPLWDDRKKPR